MKRFFVCLFALVFVFSLAVPAFADIEPDDEIVWTQEDYNNDLYQISETISNTLDDITQRLENLENQPEPEQDPNPELENIIQDVEENPDLSDIIEQGEIVEINAYRLGAVAPVEGDDTTGLKSVLLDFLGEYDPVVVEYRYQSGQNYSYLREIQPDYVWLCSCALLVVVIYCVFKAGGAIICQI